LGGDYPGLRLIKKQTIGTTVSSVQVTNAFSATYESYKVIVTGGASSGDSYGKFILGAATSGYYLGANGSSFSGAGNLLAANNAAAANFTWALNTTWLDLMIEFRNPFLAKPTGFNFSVTKPSSNSSFAGGGYHATATSYTDFTISSIGAETLTGGTIYVYGYGAS
jgi:hypothetical protein